MGVGRLEKQDFTTLTYSGQSHIGCSSRNQFAVQPDDEVSYVLPLRFRFGLGVRGGKGVLGDRPIIYDLCNGVDEDPLTLGQVEDDGVVLGGDDGGFLAIYNASNFVVVLSEQHLHVFDWVDVGGLCDGCTWDSAKRTLILQEMHDGDVVDALRTSSGDCHDGHSIF